ncbi:MAG: preprotein translocase subunit YajC [Acidiferrobacterales bacterium]|nr:preprotein translocase subunit YajC [Acidiferrobacterales bacterium]
MDFFISSALAQSGESAGGGFVSLIPLVLIFVLFYFLLIRPQQKKTKQHKEMIGALEVGDEVATSGGLMGRIVQVEEYSVFLNVAPNVDVKVQRVAIAQLLPPSAPPQEEAPKKKKKKKKSSDSTDIAESE